MLSHYLSPHIMAGSASVNQLRLTRALPIPKLSFLYLYHVLLPSPLAAQARIVSLETTSLLSSFAIGFISISAIFVSRLEP